MRPPARPRALPRSSQRASLDATARLELLFEASERLSLADDSSSTLEALVSVLVPSLADACLVGLADAAGELRLAEASHHDADLGGPGESLVLPRQLVQAYRTGTSSIVDAPELGWVPPCAHDARSAIFTPLKHGSRVLGALALFLCQPDRAYDGEDVKLVEKLSSRAALAIERARLFESDRRAAERLAALQNLTSQLSQALTLEDVASVIVEEASKILGGCPVLVYLVRADGELLNLLAHPDGCVGTTWISLVAEEAHPLREAVRSGKPVWIASPEDFAARYPRLARPQGFDQSFVCVPLIVDRRPIGALVLGFERSEPFEASEQAFMQAVAHQCAHALDRARIYSEAKDAIRVRDDFLAVASHELNTPLTSLKLALGHLRRDRSHEPEALARLLGVIERQADRLGILVRDLLDVSKLTGGSISLELAETDIVAAVRSVLERYALSFQKSGSLLSFVAPASLVGRWDGKRIEQVTSSLVSNAIKFGDGKPIDVRIEQVENDARITVRDHGVGIPEETQLRIFDRFERAVATPHYGGFGLGLWLARKVLEAMGGRIEVESQPGQGATFIVKLPLDGSTDRDAPTRD